MWVGRGTWSRNMVQQPDTFFKKNSGQRNRGIQTGTFLWARFRRPQCITGPPTPGSTPNNKNNTSIGDTNDFRRPHLLWKCNRSEPRPWSSVGGMWVGRGTWSRNMVQQPDTFFEIFRAEEQWDSSRYIPLLNM